MAEETPTATVFVYDDGLGEPSEHNGAVNVDIHDGVLVIDQGQTSWAYAPGQWAEVQIVEDK